MGTQLNKQVIDCIAVPETYHMVIAIMSQLAMNTPIYLMALRNYKRFIQIQQKTHNLKLCYLLKAQFLPDWFPFCTENISNQAIEWITST